MEHVAYRWVSLTLALVFFILSLWLIVEEVRLPPGEGSLVRVVGAVETTSRESVGVRGYQTGTETVIRLQGRSGKFSVMSEQPGSTAAAGLQPGDEVELYYDPWPFPHPNSWEVYAIAINGHPVVDYQQMIAAHPHRGGLACTAILFLFLGIAALSITGWGTPGQERFYRGLQWIRGLIGR